MSRKKSLTTFQLSFMGEFCEVLANFNAIQQDGMSMPLTVQGYFLDADEEFLYMGSSHIEIDRAIRVDDVKFIQIINQDDPLKEYLAQTPVPKNKGEGN